MDTSPLAGMTFITLSGFYLLAFLGIIAGLFYVAEKQFLEYCKRHNIGE